MPSAKGNEPSWAIIHDEDTSWRKKLIGDISDLFVVPRYVRLFYDTFGDLSDQDFCEIGSGNGDMPQAILKANRGTIQRYVTSEVFPEGVAWLRKVGLEAVQGNAEDLPWNDGEFDASVEFDVMHHVDNPRRMAREMLRVARGRCLLVESNGLSVFRRLRELTPGHRAAGERSFAPWAWRGFFENQPGYRLIEFKIDPFLFPFKCPGWFLPVLVRFNRLIERVPFLRWQCSSVMIRVQYEKIGRITTGIET